MAVISVLAIQQFPHRRFVGVMVAALLLVATSGCLIVPTRFEHHTDHGTHRPLDGGLYNDLREGESTKSSIEQLVGRRDVSLAHDAIWVYSWEERCEWRMLGITAYGGGEFGDEGVSIHYVIVEFDGSGVLARKCRRHNGRINGLARNLDEVMVK